MIYIQLFYEFFIIGLFTFGGGYAMIPLIENAVLSHEWLSEDLFISFVGICESTPGPIAVNMATYIGSTQAGLLGSVVATLAVTLPSFIIIILIASILTKLTENQYFKNFIKGINPVVIALIISTGIILVLKSLGLELQNDISFNFDYKSLIIICILALIYVLFKTVFKKKPNTILLIIISALLGLIISIL